MFISKAWAVETIDATTGMAAQPPGAMETMLLNVGFVGLLIAVFYLLMIRPQQKRIKTHTDMLGGLGTGADIVTQGGMIGRIDKEIDDKRVRLDVGDGVKIVVLRSAISAKLEDFISDKNAK